MNDDPYQPPTDSQIRGASTRRFRWGLIPATFCFGLFLPATLLVSGGTIVLTMRSWRRFADLWNAGERAIPLLAITFPSLTVSFVIIVVTCAVAWKNGKWFRAVVLSVAVCLVMPGSEAFATYLIPSVYMRILLTDQIPSFVSARGEEWHRPQGL